MPVTSTSRQTSERVIHMHVDQNKKTVRTNHCGADEDFIEFLGCRKRRWRGLPWMLLQSNQTYSRSFDFF